MSLFFYTFALSSIIGSIGVILSSSSIHSLLWLIFTFCNAAGVCILLGAEYLSMTLIIVYVGAVAVLFLFVVMMLNQDNKKDDKLFSMKKLISVFSALCILVSIIVITFAYYKNTHVVEYLSTNEYETRKYMSGVDLYIDANDIQNNVDVHTLQKYHEIGLVLYTKYIVAFQTVGIILLVAMIGCIGLTLRYKVLNSVSKSQNTINQVTRRKEDSVIMMKVQKDIGIDM